MRLRYSESFDLFRRQLDWLIENRGRLGVGTSDAIVRQWLSENALWRDQPIFEVYAP